MEDYSKYFPFPLREQQQKVFEALCKFAGNPDAKIFVLRGYAGTGKTTLMGGFIKKLGELTKEKYAADNSMEESDNSSKEPVFHLLATTGRAAKILKDKTNYPTRTVHSLVYSFDDLSEDMEKIAATINNPQPDKTGQLELIFVPQTIKTENQCIYIVDEASMLSDKKNPSGSFARFGEGDVLGDLLKYDVNGKFVFVGDPCQLPPVGQQFSPALEADYLSGKYKKNVLQMELTDIIRHNETSGILLASLRLRQLYQRTKNQQATPGVPKQWSYLPLKGYDDIYVKYTTIDLVNSYVYNLKQHDFEYTTLICHTNRQCASINNTVRNMLNNNPVRLIVGDLLMVTQNNYLYPLVNGDLVTVESISDYERRANMTFRKVKVMELASKQSYSLLLLEETLITLQPNITNEQHKALMIDFYYRMKDKGIHYKSKEFKNMMQKDEYLNALRVSYGYALTCHKSQGGEWDDVFLYLDNKIQAMNPPEIYQWWYTAITRAKENLHVVNDWFVK